MTGLRLYKKEKLCGVTTIESLFASSWRHSAGVNTFFAYPWRAVWRFNPKRNDLCARFLISVPKKKLKHAVDRVLMRRRGREAYRLNRDLFPAQTCGADILFIYVADRTLPYDISERSVRRILKQIGSSFEKDNSENDPA